MAAKVVITGAAGLVGQNLIARLKGNSDFRLVGIDKHPTNTPLLRQLHPEIETIEADLAVPGPWMEAFAGAEAIVLNQAQIGGLHLEEFQRNNVTATELILDAARQYGVSYIVHISSSVVRSKAVDFYTETKRPQEALVVASGFKHVVLRPTLMFGWFDRKHLGWLRRFMARSPIFPIPGDGRYLRQPLYVGDLAGVIIACLQRKLTGVHDISGRTPIDYIDIIREIKSIIGSRAAIVKIPYSIFWYFLWGAAQVLKNPPFTTSQLEALVIPETFPITDWPTYFGIDETPLRQALAETFLHPTYSQITLDF